MWIYHDFNGTIFPCKTVDISRRADDIYEAMKGSGSDRNAIMVYITELCNSQRQELRTAYEMKYNEDLIERLKKELSGDFENVITGLMVPPTSYDVFQLRASMKGIGTRETTLIDILSTRTKEQLENIKLEYEVTYGTTLEKDIMSDTTGDFQKLLLALLAANRDPNPFINWDIVYEDARKMYGNKQEKVKPDKATFINVFAHYNLTQMEAVFNAYQYIASGQIIQKAIKEVFEGDAREAFLQLFSAVRNKIHYYAERLYTSMKGFGTRDADLVRILVSRSEIDLEAIREEYLRTYQISLYNAVDSECSGAYKCALLSVIIGNKHGTNKNLHC